MKIVCPKCKQPIPAEGVNIAKALAYCNACQEGFDLDDLVEPEALPAERPADAQCLLVRDADKLALALPRGGFKGIGCFFTFFALFWNGITWLFVVLTILGMVGAVPTNTVKSSSPPAVVLLFLIPFMVIGIVTGLIALYCVFGETSVAMDSQELMFRRTVLGRNWDRTYPIAKIKEIKRTESYKQNDVPVYGVGIHIEGKSMAITFGSGLKEEEKNWLIYELFSFWQEQKKKAGV